MLAAGTRIGPYEIVASLGAGGMGEVYRAKDHALGREVAIKVLPDAFASDPDRLARFEREAKALAAINHPNIAQVYGFEKGPAEAGHHIDAAAKAGHHVDADVASGFSRTTALVMELLEGRTLREVLSEGPMPARKAIDAGAQLARGLAAAHDRGLIHRDLKPENVFVLSDGRIKILDFGLARQMDAPVSGSTQTMTAAFRGTDPGTVMGTVGYMAPEQVRGAALDHRADLFALGAVIYEMLSGQRAFQRDTAAETMTAILREDPPDLLSSRAHLSPAIDRIVRHCLEKNPIERFQTARDVAFALDSLSGSGSGPGAVIAAPEARSNRERWTWAAVVAALLAAVTFLALRPSATEDTAPSAPMRLTLPLPEGVRLPDSVAVPARLALSPDGQQLAFVGLEGFNATALWLQSLRDPGARKIDDTVRTAGLYWSPDNQWLLFGMFSPRGMVLKKLSMDGGAPISLGDRAGWAAWAPDGTILLEPVRGEPVLLRTTSAGGPMAEVTPRVVNGSAFGHLSFLPDGRHFLHRYSAPGAAATAGIHVASLDSPDRQLVIQGSDVSQAVFANGHLLYARNGAIWAHPFDLTTLKTTGDPQMIADDVVQSGAGAGFTVSQAGTLAYQPRVDSEGSQLRWFDRKGVALNTLADVAAYSNLELSPDGRRLLVSVLDAGATARDIYIVDTLRGLRQRLTFDASEERSAIWSADGASVIYTSKGLDLYQRSSGFTGGETALVTDGLSKDPNDVSPDGRLLLYRVTSGPTSNDVVMMPLDGSGPPRKVLDSAYNENSSQFSPDGRSIVYVADEAGRSEIYVMSLEPGGGKIQISTDGGASPRWRRDGQEILYLNADHSMMAVPVKGSGARFEAGTPSRLFEVDHVPSAGPIFDVTADGQRFIVNSAAPSKVKPHLVVIVNWPALLKKTGAQ
jgi:Tol biopolymer transport system component